VRPHEFVTGLDHALWVSAAIAMVGAIGAVVVLRVGDDPHTAEATDEP
jgi:hypothetical protein